MKIVFIAPRFHTNQYVISKTLINRGHDVDFIVQKSNKLEDHTIVKPILTKKSIFGKIISYIFKLFLSPNKIDSKEIFYFFPSYIYLKKKLKELNPDIIIYRDRTPLTFISYIIARKIGVKVNILYNQSPIYQQSEKYKFLKSHFFPKIRYTPVLYSSFSKEKNIKKEVISSEIRSYYVPFIFDKQKNIFFDGDLESKIINILCIGKYRAYKNHFFLVSAFSKINNLSKYRLTIIGQCNNYDEEKYYNQLSNFIKANKMETHIKLIKNIDYNKMSDYYVSSDVFILPSSKELASISIIEAMSYGLIPISTDLNGTASYINMDYGYVFKSDDEDSLIKILNNLVNIDILRFRKLNQEFFNNNFTDKNLMSSLNAMLVNEFKIKL